MKDIELIELSADEMIEYNNKSVFNERLSELRFFEASKIDYNDIFICLVVKNETKDFIDKEIIGISRINIRFSKKTGAEIMKRDLYSIVPEYRGLGLVKMLENESEDKIIRWLEEGKEYEVPPLNSFSTNAVLTTKENTLKFIIGLSKRFPQVMESLKNSRKICQ